MTRVRTFLQMSMLGELRWVGGGVSVYVCVREEKCMCVSVCMCVCVYENM